MDLADLGDAIHQARHLRAEHRLQLLVGGQSVLDRVVQQPGHHGGDVQAQVRENAGHLHRVDQVGLAREPGLPLVHLGAEDVGLSQQVQVASGVVGGDLIKYVVQSNHGMIFSIKKERANGRGISPLAVSPQVERKKRGGTRAMLPFNS